MKGVLQKLFALVALIISRGFEVAIGLIVLGFIGFPLLIFLLFRKLFKGKAIFEKVSIVGKNVEEQISIILTVVITF